MASRKQASPPAKKTSSKTALAPIKLDPWVALQALVLDSVTSAHSKRAYRQALAHFQAWCGSATGSAGIPEFNKATVQRYRAALEAEQLAASSINVRLSAIRKLALEAADNGLLAPAAASAIARVKGAKRHGTRTGNWLTRGQAEQILALPDRATNKGKRDRALLCLLFGCGLRREELALLTPAHVQQRDGRWVLLDLSGKGNRTRTVPMPAWTKVAIDAWLLALVGSGGAASTGASGAVRLLRAVNKGGRVVGTGMTSQAIFAVVQQYGREIGLHIAPHDLRRTFAKLAHKGHAALEQIQISLGHASIQTTERYLGIEQDLTDAPCDHLGLRV